MDYIPRCETPHKYELCPTWRVGNNFHRHSRYLPYLNRQHGQKWFTLGFFVPRTLRWAKALRAPEPPQVCGKSYVTK